MSKRKKRINKMIRQVSDISPENEKEEVLLSVIMFLLEEKKPKKQPKQKEKELSDFSAQMLVHSQYR